VLGVGDRGARPAARPASAVDASFDDQAYATIAVDAATVAPAAGLLAAIADGIGRIYPPSLERYGLTSRDRIGSRSNHPLWEPAVRIAKILGVAEFELFEHHAGEPTIVVEPFETPTVLVSQQVRRLPVPQQVFLLAYALGPIASRLFAAIGLTAAELEVALVAATRLVIPTFTLRRAPGDEVEDARETLRKSVFRKQRRAIELAAHELVAQPPADLTTWQAAVGQTAIRAAALIADDVVASIEAMRYIAELPDARGAALVQASGAVRDLMRFWISSRAAAVRVRTGMIAGA
jgi:hypothetical protein